MAMWSMIVMGLAGMGFWTPLNLIAHTYWRSVPLDGAFSWPGLFIGMVVHLAMSIALGMGLPSWCPDRRLGHHHGGRRPGRHGVRADRVANHGVPGLGRDRPGDGRTVHPWVFAIGHLMYGWSPAWPSPAPEAAWAWSEPPADPASSTGGQFCTR